MDNEILEAAVELAVEKKTDLAQALAQAPGWAMTRIASALQVSRPHLALVASAKNATRARKPRPGDDALVARIQAIIEGRPAYGYRRAHCSQHAGVPPRVQRHG